MKPLCESEIEGYCMGFQNSQVSIIRKCFSLLLGVTTVAGAEVCTHRAKEYGEG